MDLVLPFVGFLETERQRRQRLRLGCHVPRVSLWSSIHPAPIHVVNSQNQKIQQAFTEGLLCARQVCLQFWGSLSRSPSGTMPIRRSGHTAGCWCQSNALSCNHCHHHSFIPYRNEGLQSSKGHRCECVVAVEMGTRFVVAPGERNQLAGCGTLHGRRVS